MYDRFYRFLHDIDYCVSGIIEHHQHYENQNTVYALNKVYHVLMYTIQKLRNIYYETVLQPKLVREIQQTKQKEQVIHFTSTVLVRLALDIKQRGSSLSSSPLTEAPIHSLSLHHLS